MGFYHSAYFAYGFQIPDMDAGRLEDGVPSGTDVGFLNAGAYDREKSYLVTQHHDIDLGGYGTVRPQDVAPEQYASWNRQLAAAAEALGVMPAAEPGWIVIPAIS
ncbi:hypothetical protein [Streptomyces sp. SGAir0957]